jgi:acetolactate synthase I/II/III large subunit
MTDKLEQLAKGLAASNVGAAFGVSGSGPSFKLINHLLDNGVPYYPLSHEASAAIAAGAYTFLSNKKGIAITIKGPGFANMVPGLAANYMERYGAICISEDYDDAVSTKKMHKRLNQFSMVSAVTGGMASLLHLDGLSAFLQNVPGNEMPKYFAISNTQLPEDLAQAEENDAEVADTYLDIVLEKIAHAERPVLIVGSLIKRLGIDISHLNLPVFTTAQAKGTIDEAAPNACGIYTGVGKELVAETTILKESDCVITIGLRNFEILGVDDKKGFTNFDTLHPCFTDDDTAVNIDQIKKIITVLAKPANWATKQITENRKGLIAYTNRYQWMPGNAFDVINKLTYNHTMVLDTGTFCTIGEHIWECKAGRNFIGSSNGRNLGLSIPTTIGACMALLGQPVFCAVGDGGIRYYAADIRTIAERQLPVCILFMSDGRYGSIISNLANFKTNDTITTPMGNNWLQVVQAMGIASHQITSTEAFKSQIDLWDKKTPLFLQCEFDPETYLSVTLDMRG